jgi:hypothetical protein
MKTFPAITPEIPLSNDVSALVEALVLSLRDPEKHSWDVTVSLMEETVRRHMFTNVLNATNPVALILWNTCFLLIKTLEASPFDPSVWTRAFKPFDDLSVRLGVEASLEFMLSNANLDDSDGTDTTENKN